VNRSRHASDGHDVAPVGSGRLTVRIDPAGRDYRSSPSTDEGPVDGFVLGVDLDGVCADYETALRASVASRRGVETSTLPPQQRPGSFEEWGLDAASFREAHRVAVVEDRIFRTMQPYPDVADVLWELSDAGVWIRVITHRLLFNGLHEVSAADTAAWLDLHRIPYRDLCFIGDKQTVGADLYVDDSPHIITALRAAGRAAVVFDQRYNRHMDGPRVHSWRELGRLVLMHTTDQERTDG
jgi:5'-nucleotidase